MVDSFNLGLYHRIFDKRIFRNGNELDAVGIWDGRKGVNTAFSMKMFGGILGMQLIALGRSLDVGNNNFLRQHHLLNNSEINNGNGLNRGHGLRASSMQNNGYRNEEVVLSMRDVNGCIHKWMKNEAKGVTADGKKYTKVQPCTVCGKQIAYMCLTCNVGCCYNPNEKDGGICCCEHLLLQMKIEF